MFEVGAKIDFWQFYVQSRNQNRCVTILNLYMGGGGELTVFPVSIDVSTPVSTDVSTPVSTDVRVYAHLFDFFGNFRNSWKIYEPNKWKKCVSLLEFGAFLDFVAILAPQQQKKRKPKDSILPRWGEKNDRVCFPQKESFGKSNLVYVKSRSQNRFLTTLCSK